MTRPEVDLEISIGTWQVDPDFHRRAGPPPPRARGISYVTVRAAEMDVPGGGHRPAAG